MASLREAKALGVGSSPENAHAFARTRSRVPGTFLFPPAGSSFDDIFALSLSHLTNSLLLKRDALSPREVDGVTNLTNRERQSTQKSRSDFVKSYMPFMKDKLELSPEQEANIRRLSPMQLDAGDALLQMLQFAQPTETLAGGNLLAQSELVTFIQKFAQNPPSEEVLAASERLFGEGIIFFYTGFNAKQIMERLVGKNGRPTPLANEIARQVREKNSCIIEYGPDGEHVHHQYTRMTNGTVDGNDSILGHMQIAGGWRNHTVPDDITMFFRTHPNEIGLLRQIAYRVLGKKAVQEQYGKSNESAILRGALEKRLPQLSPDERVALPLVESFTLENDGYSGGTPAPEGFNEAIEARRNELRSSRR